MLLEGLIWTAIPQIRVEPELRAELEAVLKQSETLTDFVDTAARSAIAIRRVQTEFHARAQAASQAYRESGLSVPGAVVLDRLQSKLDAKCKELRLNEMGTSSQIPQRIQRAAASSSP